VMFFADPFAAFANIARQLRPGGRVVFACWQSAERNTWRPREVLDRYAPPLPPRADGLPVPGPFAFGDVSFVESVLERAGLTRIAHVDHEYEWSDPVPGPLYDPAQFEPMGLDEPTLARAVADLRAAEQRVARDGVVHQVRRYRIFTALK
jgi:SAM-dependent methyltransferase